jgi:hypothetical protein
MGGCSGRSVMSALQNYFIMILADDKIITAGNSALSTTVHVFGHEKRDTPEKTRPRGGERAVLPRVILLFLLFVEKLKMICGSIDFRLAHAPHTDRGAEFVRQ